MTKEQELEAKIKELEGELEKKENEKAETTWAEYGELRIEEIREIYKTRTKNSPEKSVKEI
jgi:hypothetical protein